MSLWNESYVERGQYVCGTRDEQTWNEGGVTVERETGDEQTSSSLNENEKPVCFTITASCPFTSKTIAIHARVPKKYRHMLF